MGTITKALDLLNFFSRTTPEIGLNEFARLAGREKTTVHRHLVELEQNGFVERHPATRAYRLGPAILRLTGVREATHPVRSVLRPIVEQLAARVGELCHASLLQGHVLSPVYHADPQAHGTQVHFDEAELLPLHATSSGLAVLAFSAPEFVDSVLAGPLTAFTGRTITDPATLRRLLQEVRAKGFCTLDQAFDGEVSSLAAPIFGPDADVIGAISVAVPSVRVAPDKMAAIHRALCASVRQATTTAGGSLPPAHADRWAMSPDPGETAPFHFIRAQRGPT